jgi:hypothetical protein
MKTNSDTYFEGHNGRDVLDEIGYAKDHVTSVPILFEIAIYLCNAQKFRFVPVLREYLSHLEPKIEVTRICNGRPRYKVTGYRSELC